MGKHADMNKMKKIGLALTMLMSPAVTGLFAQAPGDIQGKVSEKSGVPAIGVMLWVEANGQLIKTMANDEDEGRYSLKPLDPGTYILHVLTADQDTFKLEVAVNGNITTWMDINLSDPQFAANRLNDVEVYAWTDPLINKEGGSMVIMRAKDIKNIPVKRDIKQLVGAMSSDIKVNEKGDAYVRGSRADAINYYIDGMRLREGFRSPPSSAIESVQVYTGGVPAKYGDCLGGVVVVETQSYFNLYREWQIKQSSAQ